MTPRELTWKHGQQEQADFEAISKVADRKQAESLLVAFAEKYPDSDYHDLALVLAMGISAVLKDINAQVHAAKVLIESPSAQAAARVAAYVTLLADLSPYVFATDPDLTRKLADLEKWTRCGMEALGAEVRPDNQQPEAFEKNRQASESVLDRTAGYVALIQQDYALAESKLDAARKLNSEDVLTNLWLAEANFSSGSPDLNGGIFYLARAANLAPQVPQMADVLKQMYVIVHGSDKGLSDLRTLAKSNTAPPAGFNVWQQPKEKHHYGTALAITAIVGLMVYGVVAHPQFMQALGQTLGGGSAAPSSASAPAPAYSSAPKMMIFGGPSHRTYLGCLSCSEYDSDSVFNQYGEHGSRYSSESIWNPYSQFGSPYSEYSACNPYANDAPVIVDNAGSAYGRLTINRLNLQIGAGQNFYNWLASAVCHP